MRIAAIDLETIPDASMIHLLPDPEPNKTLKDPAKIAEDIAKKKEKQLDDMGMDPLMNIIRPEDATTAEATLEGRYVTLAHAGAEITLPAMTGTMLISMGSNHTNRATVIFKPSRKNLPQSCQSGRGYSRPSLTLSITTRV